MPDESTQPTTSVPTDPADTEPTAESASHPPAAIGTLWLAALALGWLALMVRSTQVSLAGLEDTVVVTAAAIGLPAAISAALVCGAGIGLAVRHLFRAHHAPPIVRFGTALGAGLLTGVATGATLALTASSAEQSLVLLLSGAVAAAATIGGAIAGIRAGAVVGAGVASSLAVFLLTLLRELFTTPLLTLFGADHTDPVSLLTAQRWLGLTTSLLGGVLAGLVAFAYLRRAARRGGDAPRWPAYLWAGGGAGVMLLLTEVITLAGGSRLLSWARAISEGDSIYQDLAYRSRTNAALMVFFVGAIIAIIAFGRTLPSREEESPAEHAKQAPSGRAEEAPSAEETGHDAAEGATVTSGDPRA